MMILVKAAVVAFFGVLLGYSVCASQMAEDEVDEHIHWLKIIIRNKDYRMHLVSLDEKKRTLRLWWLSSVLLTASLAASVVWVAV